MPDEFSDLSSSILGLTLDFVRRLAKVPRKHILGEEWTDGKTIPPKPSRAIR